MTFNTESPTNYEQKCCCALVLDVSGSMGGEPIRQLNEGIQAFYKDIENDLTSANRLEIALITFSDTVDTLVQPSLVASFKMPNLTVKGSTRLVDGVRQAIIVVNERKKYYKETGQPYYRPWIVVITDGAPDPGQDVYGLAAEVNDYTSKKGFFFLPIGVENADMNMLAQIAAPGVQPEKLQGLKFAEFFKWLSGSMSAVTSSGDGAKVNLPSPRDWTVGFDV